MNTNTLIEICLVIVTIVSVVVANKRTQDWWIDREEVLLDEIEGPYWTHDGYMGDAPENSTQLIQEHERALEAILGLERFIAVKERRLAVRKQRKKIG